MSNKPLNDKDPKSLEALEQIWAEYKKMRFGGYWRAKIYEELQQ